MPEYTDFWPADFCALKTWLPKTSSKHKVDSQMQGHFPVSMTSPTTCILRLCQFLSLEEELIVQFPSQSLSSDLKQKQNNSVTQLQGHCKMSM